MVEDHEKELLPYEVQLYLTLKEVFNQHVESCDKCLPFALCAEGTRLRESLAYQEERLMFISGWMDLGERSDIR